MSITIETLSAATTDLLDQIAEGVFDNPIDPAQLRRFVGDPLHLMKLAIADGQVVGMASGTILLHPDKPPQLFINEVGVSPDWRRQGIGREMVSALVQDAGGRGCTYAWLGTEVDNQAGNACFARVPGGERAETFVLYEWDIEA